MVKAAAIRVRVVAVTRATGAVAATTTRINMMVCVATTAMTVTRRGGEKRAASILTAVGWEGEGEEEGEEGGGVAVTRSSTGGIRESRWRW